VLAERFVKADPTNDPAGETNEENHGRILGAIIRRYEAVLRTALDNRWTVLVTIVVVLIGSYLLYRALGSEFLPEFDESAFVLDYRAPAGSSLAETDRMLRHVEEMLLKTAEVESYSRRTGLELGLFVTEPNTGDFAVKLKPGHKRSTKEVEADLREQIAEAEPALEVEFVGIVPDVIGDLQGNPEPIEVKLFSEDASALQAKADEVEGGNQESSRCG
jgi:multidrug efflux pump subunit AcrB